MTKKLCEICGEPMPDGEEMFKFHGYSGKCPKPPLKKPTPTPAWHDAPTCAGLWVRVNRNRRDAVQVTNVEYWKYGNPLESIWYGPIPQDKEGEKS